MKLAVIFIAIAIIAIAIGVTIFLQKEKRLRSEEDEYWKTLSSGLKLNGKPNAYLKKLREEESEQEDREDSPLRKRTVLTKNEQPMYFRLLEAFPEHVVLAQVSFSALIRTAKQATRNRFDRKVADFVICTKAFEVLGIVELDDSSHRGKEEKDADRDRLLNSAGYRVFRYRFPPNTEDVRNAIIGKVSKALDKSNASIATPLK
ncbi:DUF2726 domain-containing protein [Herbaspirillum sp. HC18]|nr:DUF2726 domain-containing protein [Herbaspirillum sp. HC18]